MRAAIILNLFGRFFWAFTLEQSTFIRPDFFVIIVASVEIARRAMWGFFRVEYETLSNYEQYRQFALVPKLSGPPKTKKRTHHTTASEMSGTVGSSVASFVFESEEEGSHTYRHDLKLSDDSKTSLHSDVPLQTTQHIPYQRLSSTDWEDYALRDEHRSLSVEHIRHENNLRDLSPLPSADPFSLNVQYESPSFEHLLCSKSHAAAMDIKPKSLQKKQRYTLHSYPTSNLATFLDDLQPHPPANNDHTENLIP
jgi:hypothetical protein